MLRNVVIAKTTYAARQRHETAARIAPSAKNGYR
jgi:hypothetical protein